MMPASTFSCRNRLRKARPCGTMPMLTGRYDRHAENYLAAERFGNALAFIGSVSSGGGSFSNYSMRQANFKFSKEREVKCIVCGKMYTTIGVFSNGCVCSAECAKIRAKEHNREHRKRRYDELFSWMAAHNNSLVGRQIGNWTIVEETKGEERSVK